MLKYKLVKPITIKADTEIGQAPSKIEFGAPFGEIVIGFGKNHSASIYFDEDLMKSYPDYFIPYCDEDQ